MAHPLPPCEAESASESDSEAPRSNVGYSSGSDAAAESDVEEERVGEEQQRRDWENDEDDGRSLFSGF
jgi:hypothetical protein